MLRSKDDIYYIQSREYNRNMKRTEKGFNTVKRILKINVFVSNFVMKVLHRGFTGYFFCQGGEIPVDCGRQLKAWHCIHIYIDV